MKKILSYLLFYVILFLVLIINASTSINALNYTCKYEPNETSGVANNIELTISFVTNNNYKITKFTDIVATTIYGTNTTVVLYDQIFDSEFLNNMYNILGKDKTSDYGLCPKIIRSCMATYSSGTFYNIPVVAIDNKYHSKIYSGASIQFPDGVVYKIDPSETSCQTYNYQKGNSKHEAADSSNYNSCSDNLIEEYGENLEILFLKVDKEYEVTKERLINVCDSMFNSMDYYYDGVVNSCISYCLKIENLINEHEKGNISIVDGECGFSDRLIIWIANIVRWIKYIIPVAVMALGILDFIKAMASEKDDEMKKAQGRFIKRLIAAALIFIIPFIIEFVLDKTGFDANGCGIIDL